MLKCRELVNNADELIDGAHLSPARRLSLHAHLLLCQHCRRYVRQLRELRAHLRGGDAACAEDAEVQVILGHLDQRS